MGDVSHEGRTVLFVSHNMAAVEALCESGVLLHHGSVVASGTAADVVSEYLRRSEARKLNELAERPDRKGNGRLRVQAIDASIRTGRASEFRLKYEAQSPLPNVAVNLGIFTTSGEGVLFLSNEISGELFEEIPSHGDLVCQFAVGNLVPGRYSMNVYCTVNGEVADWVVDAVTFDVGEGDFYGTGRLPPHGYGNVLVPYQWSVEP